MQTVANNTSNLFSSRVKTLELTDFGVVMIDQTILPHKLEYVTITTPEAMIDAIKTMIVRGAPAIGIAGAFGLVLAARIYFAQTPDFHTPEKEAFIRSRLNTTAAQLRDSRPTAVNLMWAIDAMTALMAQTPIENLLEALTEKAQQIYHDDLNACHQMGEHGATLMPKGARIITHCNAGALATAGYGTALGVIRSAFAKDNTVTVYADETRPRMQGAKLTTWELHQDQIPVTLITDGMSASLMRQGKIDAVIVGADRIAANGDTVNKIGTYHLALAAHAHNIPFYVAAPLSTFDMSLPNGDAIPIEYRDPDEIHTVNEKLICPEGIEFLNPAFDMTPAKFITAIISERGIAKPDFTQSLKQWF